MDAIMACCRVCRLGLCDEGQPYVVPVSFGYDGESVYIHGAGEGRKVEVLKRNSRVCLEFDLLNELVTAEQACSWTMRYESVVAFGRARFLDDAEEKHRALCCIMAQYSRA